MWGIALFCFCWTCVQQVSDPYFSPPCICGCLQMAFKTARNMDLGISNALLKIIDFHWEAGISICPSIHLSICPSIHPSSVYPFVHPSFHLPVHPSIRPSVCPSINSLTHPPTHPSVIEHCQSLCPNNVHSTPRKSLF